MYDQCRTKRKLQNIRWSTSSIHAIRALLSSIDKFVRFIILQRKICTIRWIMHETYSK
uniref:Uncharacterized protein n=1 Tax=Solanum lycopersicum TaxID=4081 RepID=A0A3Q7G9H1_SOLLC